MFMANTSGGMSQRSTMLKTTLAPETKESDEHDDVMHVDPIEEQGVPEIDDEPLDVDYIDYLLDSAMNTDGKIRRVRTQGVS